MTDTLFSHAASQSRLGQPLAERMRPSTLAEMVNAGAIGGGARILERLAAGHMPPSLILYGPPGTGKTTFAQLLANAAGARAVSMSAVQSGVKELREIATEADLQRSHYGRQTLLFVDEIHRFSKAGQDALLPHVERGVFILCGATTENPSFSLTAALLSRCMLLRFEPHTDDALRDITSRALRDAERGLGARGLTLADDAMTALVVAAGGDARRCLGLLEIAADRVTSLGQRRIELSDVHAAAEGSAWRHDRRGDEHYALVSAFIKSLRGSDADAAVYWLVRMLEAGEEPRFVVRRMVIFASEDVGNADPKALALAIDAHRAFEFLGMPEASFALTQCAIYLALAPKSNTALTAYANARRLMKEHGQLAVPQKLRNPSSGVAKVLGHGAGYQYPHDFSGAYVAESYLPDAIEGAQIVVHTHQNGFEKELESRRRK